MPIRVCLRELKTRLGTYLRSVKSGRVVVVTERGRAVAKLAPLDDEEKDLESRLEDMAARGEIRLGSGLPLQKFEPLRIPGVSLSDAVFEDREERF